jgi:hypothetical protein
MSYNAVYDKSCFLTKDLSILLVGFMGAEFVDSFGNRPYTRDRPEILERLESTMQLDLWHWEKFYYTLMTQGSFAGEHWWPPNPSQDYGLEIHSEVVGADVLLKCQDRKGDDATVVREEFVAAVLQAGYVVEGDCLKNFGPLKVIDSRDQNRTISTS